MTLLVVLLVALAVSLTQADSHLVSVCIVPLLVSLIACHIDRNGEFLAETLIFLAVLLIPRAERQEWRDIWIDHVRSAREHGLVPLSRGLSILIIAAPALAVGLRVGRTQKAPYR
jgi:predicted nucleic acid-binding protein